MLAYREEATRRGIAKANIVKPETGHPAFDKACHLLGLEMRHAPIVAETAQVDVDAMASMIDENTAAIVGSACNYGYGTIDPIDKLSALALDRGVGLHVDGCLGGFLLPFGEMLGLDIPVFDFRHPGVTTISADTHKYGYSVKGTSILMFRDKQLRNGQYFFLTDWSGGAYASPGIDGSRSSGLLAATWASLVSLGREGYLKYAKKIFDTAYAMQDVVRAQPELRIIGNPSFCFSFTSDEFDIYHVNDALRSRGWRLNGQQYPGALHMKVPFNVIDFLDRAELVYGDRIGVIDEPNQPAGSLGHLTWRQVAERARALAAGLDALGVRQGERVAIVSQNSARLFATLFGVSGYGRVVVPINFRLNAEEVRYIVEHSKATVLLVDPELDVALRDVTAKHRFVLGPESDDILFRFDRQPNPWIAPSEDAVASINYTSGTTARPKGVELTHRNLYVNALTLGWHTGVNDRDTYLWVVPMFHCNGWGMVYAITGMGGCHVILRRVDGAEVLSSIADHGVTFMPSTRMNIRGNNIARSAASSRVHVVVKATSTTNEIDVATRRMMSPADRRPWLVTPTG